MVQKLSTCILVSVYIWVDAKVKMPHICDYNIGRANFYAAGRWWTSSPLSSRTVFSATGLLFGFFTSPSRSSCGIWREDHRWRARRTQELYRFMWRRGGPLCMKAVSFLSIVLSVRLVECRGVRCRHCASLFIENGSVAFPNVTSWADKRWTTESSVCLMNVKIWQCWSLHVGTLRLPKSDGM